MTVKEKITELATELFLKAGVRSITMDEVAANSGVSKRTLYENFRDKDDLIRNCLDLLDKKFNSDYEEMSAKSENTMQLSFNLIKLGVIAINEINPLFFEELKKYHYKTWKEVHSVNIEKQRSLLMTILKKGINQGVFRNNFNIDVVVVLLIEQLRMLHDHSLFPPGKFSKQEVFENVFINFFRGIATQKGLDLIDEFLDKESENFITV